MSKVYMLIGVPGSGKSTWIAGHDWTKECVLVSTDNLIEIEAGRLGKTYNEVFKDYVDTATQLMNAQVRTAVAEGKDIIWDQTNIGRKSRQAKLAQMPGYYKIAVVFATPEENEWRRRLDGRVGKTIPVGALTAMADALQLPIDDEFDEIWRT